ncbi:MAG: baseplate J/gp47 family protein [Vicinamibacterales bacterium]
MSFIDRTYPDIVRDVLTNLTQGVTREVHRIDYNPAAKPPVLPAVTLERRPVRRVSFVQGFVAAADPSNPPVPFVFTANDYDLVGDTPDAADLHTIRFRPFGQKPAPGTDLTINYYPRTTDPAPVTDLNVGSVVRTLLEAVSREVGIVYAQLNAVYDSAFVDTATGDSLDRVVALLGYRRFPAGRPAGAVVFRRRAGSVGSITIPAGTPVTDTADKVRYETVETRTMLAGESVAEVRVRGAAGSTPPVPAGTLTVIQRAIAGLDGVVNERDTTRVNEAETDEELRARAKSALLGANKGTIESIRFGLLQLTDIVRDVKVEEFPNGVPGEIRVNVALREGGSQLPPKVIERLEALRPAGIRVLHGVASPEKLAARVRLTLAGAPLPPAEIEQLRARVRQALTDEVGRRGVGERLRNRPLTASVLADDRIVDAAVALGRDGGSVGEPGADFEPAPGAAMELASVSFEAEEFTGAASAAEQAVPVDVRGAFTVQLVGGTTMEQAKASLTKRLQQMLAGLAPGVTVSSASVLQALRADTEYGIDPLTSSVTLTAGDQFVRVAQGGPSFTVQPGHRFTVVVVEVTP